MYSFGTPSVTPCSVIPPSCPALSTAPVVVAIGPAGSVPIGRGDLYGTVRSVRGPVGVAVWFGVQSFGSEFWVGVWLELGGVTQLVNSIKNYRFAENFLFRCALQVSERTWKRSKALTIRSANFFA